MDRKSVRQLCEERGLSVEALAERSKLDEKRIRAILEGRWTASPAERERIAGVFELSKEQIAWEHQVPVVHLYGHGPQFGRSP
jgi:transcriptional regulator with XRE-family HTH domain